MKNILCLVFVAALIMPLVACNKYGEVIRLNDQFVDLAERYNKAIDKADSAQDVAEAMNDYADDLEKLWPKMKAASDKYPELKDPANLPPELKESQKKAEEVGTRFAASMMKVMPYMRDPEVRKAQQRLGTIMK